MIIELDNIKATKLYNFIKNLIKPVTNTIIENKLDNTCKLKPLDLTNVLPNGPPPPPKNSKYGVIPTTHGYNSLWDDMNTDLTTSYGRNNPIKKPDVKSLFRQIQQGNNIKINIAASISFVKYLTNDGLSLYFFLEFLRSLYE